MKIEHTTVGNIDIYKIQDAEWQFHSFTSAQGINVARCLQEVYDKGYEAGRLKMVRAMEVALEEAWKNG